MCRKTIKQQFNQHLKAEQLDRRTLQIIVLQLQNYFALLGYLLFFSVGTTPISDTTVKNSAIGPLITPNLNPNPTSNALPIPYADEPSVRHSNPEGAVGPPRQKITSSASSSFLLSLNTREAFPTTMQNFTSRIFELEKLFAFEIEAYTSITAGFLSRQFF